MALRSEIVQSLLDLFDAPHYLEIGVHEGVTFKALRAAKKVAVDPEFLFDTKAAAGSGGVVIDYHEMTSDEYFGRVADPHSPFDVVFLDGLHTFDQTLRDLMNAMLVLKHRGIIVVDDVMPNSYQASLANPADVGEVRAYMAAQDPRLLGDLAWMGDVFKIPFYVQSYMQQFSYATTAEHDAQSVIWRQPRAAGSFPLRPMREISCFEFKDMIRHRTEMNVMPIEAIVAAIRSAFG